MYCCTAYRQVGPCVLGGLQPATLVVSTPNHEYNVVMRETERINRESALAPQPAVGVAGEASSASVAPAGGHHQPWPGPPGRDGWPLRCSDHR